MSYQLIDSIPVWGEPLDDAVKQMRNCQRTADACALMADHHIGYAVPIGGVIAYESIISPSGVGYDIACGNKAVLTDFPANELRARIKPIMDDIWRTLSFGIGMKNKQHVDHPLFHDDDPGWQIPLVAQLRDLAREQLGTIGSGNHYVDLFTDESDRVWIGVHFGSRGFGYKIANHFIKAAGGRDGMHVDPALITAATPLAEDYIAAMKLAGRYAYAGRDWVCDHVVKLLGAKILDEVHNHHNFAWRETHQGRELWVVRKGATPAFPGQRGFVGGSMGDNAVIIEGLESDESKVALYSSIHGAGRVMSRTAAAGKRRWRRSRHGKPRPSVADSGGQITRKMMLTWVHEKNVELRGAGTDESPHCYKRLDEVLKFHSPTIKVLHTLTPVGVAMAGEDEFDPFKD